MCAVDDCTNTNSSEVAIALARSALFVPGSRPDRFDTAAGSGADLVVLDLEDAVAPADKEAARTNVVDWLCGAARRAVLVRINPLGTPAGAQDVEALRVARGVGVMVPKVNSAADLAEVADALPHADHLVPLIETAAGLWYCGKIAAADRVVRLAFGSVDLASDLGIVSADDEEVFGPARFQIVLASRVAGIAPPFDGVSTSIDDMDRLAHEAARSRRWGFGGKLCIHPRQLGAVHGAFTPAPAEVERARRIVEAAASSGGAFQFEGSMIDKPLVDQARRTVKLSARLKS